MIVKKELLNRLKDFGLNSYESKLWVSLLGRGVSTAGELSDISNVPRSRAYDVLESLEKKGFIIVKLGKPIRYIAVQPREVVDRVKKLVHEEADQRTKLLDDLKESDLLTELDTLHKKGVTLVDPTDQSGSFRGREKMYDHLSSMIRNASRNVSIVTTAAGLKRKVSRLRNDLDKAAKRGVKVRMAVALSGSNDIKSLVKEMPGNAEVRESPRDARFMIVDGREIAFMLTDDRNVHESFDSGVWVSTPYFVSHFEDMFNKEWKDMKKL